MKRIAVYGSLRKGEYNYDRVQMGEPIATGKIHKAQLYSLGPYPCIVATDNDQDQVVVEVYDIEDDLFNGIDQMETMAGYQRRPVSVLVNESDGEVLYKAEAYFHPSVPDYHKGIVPSGDWSQR